MANEEQDEATSLYISFVMSWLWHKRNAQWRKQSSKKLIRECSLIIECGKVPVPIGSWDQNETLLMRAAAKSYFGNNIFLSNTSVMLADV